MDLRSTERDESHSHRHPRGSGGPGQWIPAFAGITCRRWLSTERSAESRCAFIRIGEEKTRGRFLAPLGMTRFQRPGGLYEWRINAEGLIQIRRRDDLGITLFDGTCQYKLSKCGRAQGSHRHGWVWPSGHTSSQDPAQL